MSWALGYRTPFPEHPLGMLVAFVFVCLAFLGLGLVIAMVSDSVPAVQALGQAIFLPLIIIGGVGVRLENLPLWARDVASFLPGKYAVDALQVCQHGAGLADSHMPLNLLSLTVIGVAAPSPARKCSVGTSARKLTGSTPGMGGHGSFGLGRHGNDGGSHPPAEIHAPKRGNRRETRNDKMRLGNLPSSRGSGKGRAAFRRVRNSSKSQTRSLPRLRLTPLAAWGDRHHSQCPAEPRFQPACCPDGPASRHHIRALQPAAWRSPQFRTVHRGRPLSSWPAMTMAATTAPATAPAVVITPAPAAAAAPWEKVTKAQSDSITYDDLPDDNSTTTPLAPDLSGLDDEGKKRMDNFSDALSDWPPAQVQDVPQRIRNLLSVCAVADVAEDQNEAHIPYIVFTYLKGTIPKAQLVKALTWVILKDRDGTVLTNVKDIKELSLDAEIQEDNVRDRSTLYAKKLLFRLLGKKPAN